MSSPTRTGPALRLGQEEAAPSLPELGAWEPELSVHVVVLADRPGADPAPLLACLAAQTYPAALIGVTVVTGAGDGGSDGDRPCSEDPGTGSSDGDRPGGAGPVVGCSSGENARTRRHQPAEHRPGGGRAGGEAPVHGRSDGERPGGESSDGGPSGRARLVDELLGGGGRLNGGPPGGESPDDERHGGGRAGGETPGEGGSAGEGTVGEPTDGEQLADGPSDDGRSGDGRTGGARAGGGAPGGGPTGHTRVVSARSGLWWRDVPACTAVVLWLDAEDTVPPTFVEAHLRGHHAVEGLVLAGLPGQEAGAADPNFPVEGSGTRRVLHAHTHDPGRVDLRSGTSAPRNLLEACADSAGGVLPAEEEILNHLLVQHGALLATDPEARYRPGGPSGRRPEDPLTRARVAHWVPTSPERTGHRGRHWRVPLAEVAVDAAGAEGATVAETVDRLLDTDTTGARITLLAGTDPQVRADLHEHYRAEPRVRIGSGEPVPDPLVPFVLRLPPDLPVEADVVRVMADEAKTSGADAVCATLPGSDLGGPRLERTAARARAAYRRPGLAPVVESGPLRPRVLWIDGETRLLTPLPGAVSRRAHRWERLRKFEREADRMREREQRLRQRLEWLMYSRAGRFLRRVLG